MKIRDVVREILRERPKVAILFISGYGDDVVARLIPTPTAELLRKPFSPDDLLHFVGTALSGWHAGRGPRLHAASPDQFNKTGERGLLCLENTNLAITSETDRLFASVLQRMRRDYAEGIERLR
jgi:CheY-like chemotaxis protein